jgi:hypothetical protein
MATDFERIITPDTLRDLAGFPAFRDGHAYYERGQVYGLVQDEEAIAAKVLGLYEYQVRLWAEGDRLGYRCTCPVGEGEELCKHGVAVGLTWLREREASREPSGTPQASVDPVKVITTYLAAQERPALISTIVERAKQDRRLCHWLLFKAARTRDRKVDRKRFHQYIDLVLDDGAVVGRYADALDQVLDALLDLLQEGAAPDAWALTEYTLAKVGAAIGPVKEGDERLQAGLDRLQEVHLKACRLARPDPGALARQLLAWRLNPKWDLFSDAVAAYADVLGSDGQAVYYALAREAWDQEPDLGPGDETPERFGRRFRLAYIMETAAKQAGDLEAQVAVRRKDLTQPSSFLGIAELYKEAGDDDQALAWAERGMEAFSGRPDPRLRDFLVRAYQAAGRHEEAARLLRR